MRRYLPAQLSLTCGWDSRDDDFSSDMLGASQVSHLIVVERASAGKQCCEVRRRQLETRGGLLGMLVAVCDAGSVVWCSVHIAVLK